MSASTSFGPFRFESQTASLSRDGVPVAIGTRAAALLGALIAADGAPVTKEALMEAGWPGLSVEEGNLSVQIANLRKAMGPRPDGQDWIATVPRVGYRLLNAPSSPPAEAAFWPSLAVLPFQNLSGDVEQEYFADGVVDDIITAFSRFKSFAVIARNSSFAYKGRAIDVREVAKDLGVRYVLEGSVRRAGERLRINAQLVDGEAGGHLWAQHFDGVTGDVFDFQDNITEAVVAIVEPQIRRAEVERARRERPQSVTAYDLYLRGVAGYYVGARDDMAFELTERAIALEPNNATYLAQAAALLQHRISAGWETGTPATRARCAEYIERALASARGDAVVMSMCGNALLQIFREFDRGAELSAQALAENPHCLFVVTHAGVANLLGGSVRDAIDLFQRALRLSPRDPLAPVPLTGIAHAQMILADYEEALIWARKSLALNANYDATHWMLIAANAHLDRMDEAQRHLSELLRLTPSTTVGGIRDAQADRDGTRLANILSGLTLAGVPAGS